MLENATDRTGVPFPRGAAARSVAAAFGVCGAVSVTAQFSLARITLAALSGNEFGAGLFLGFWLLFGGAGCVLLPAIVRSSHRPAAAFPLLLLLLGVLLPASCFRAAPHGPA